MRRSLPLTVALCAGVACLARSVHAHYPLTEWLFFRYLGYTLVCAAWALACTGFGYRVVCVLAGPGLRYSERVLLAFACGVLAFALGVFAAGIAGVLGSMFFFAWPLLLGAASGARAWRSLTRGGLRVLGVGPRARRRSAVPASVFAWARLALLALGLLAVYTQVLTPENVSYDARWYHLALAEQYALGGAIARFAEGSYLGAYPQLATWLYTWAFLLPGSLFDHVTLAAQLEWTIFLGTVPGVGLLVRRLVRGARVRWASSAMFLFPSLVLYDSNLNVGADHVLAFWAIPLALAVCVVRRALSTRSMLLLAAMAAGAALTKYQAVYLLAPAALVVVVLVLRAKRPRLLAAALAASLLLTAPHWLKNAAFYGDPLYPLLHRVLPSQPFHDGAADAMREGYFPARFLLHGSTRERAWATLEATVSFAFVPHNWKGMRIPEPTFGSLFSVLCLALPFVRGARRVWLLVACSHLGVMIWFITNHQDRFLQALLPWMAACVAAIAALVWREGRTPRLALAALVGLQLVWGTDMFFYPTHKMLRAPGIASLADFVAAGRSGPDARRKRFEHWGALHELTAPLPSDATLLLHDDVLGLGLGRRTITDRWGFQGALHYTELGSPRAVWQAYRALGVTHVVWRSKPPKHESAALRAREAVFRAALKRIAHRRRKLRGLYIAELHRKPPAARSK